MFNRFLQSGLLPLLLSAIYFAAMAPIAPDFASLGNGRNILVAMLPLLVVAAGQTIVLLTGGIDLSVTSIIALSSIAGAALITGEGGPLAESGLAAPVAVVAMITVGCLIGFINGSCIAWLKMPPFIVTLTTMMFFSGLAIWLTQTQSIYELPSEFLFLGKNIGAATSITVGVSIGVQFLLSRTLLGIGWKAMGGNPATARVSGVNVSGATILAYVLCGACAGMASVLITAQLETGGPAHWENNLLDVVGATVIGGTSLYGGRGNVLGTLCGVLLLSLIDNSLNLLNLSHFTIMMAKGGVILFAALLDTLRFRAGVQ
jgi:ribose/xylose/arabinose/galactoside ABC-type transport system permease subunit